MHTYIHHHIYESFFEDLYCYIPYALDSKSSPLTYTISDIEIPFRVDPSTIQSA